MARLRLRSALAIVVLTLLALFVALWPTLLGYGAQYALRQAQSPSLRLVWSGVHGTWRGIHIDSLESLIAVPAQGTGPIKAVPVRLELRNVWIRPSLISALVNQEALSVSGEIFGGSLSGSVSSLFSVPTTTLAIAGIDLAELALFPEVRALGLRTGSVSGSITMASAKPGQIPSGTFSLAVKNFSVPSNQYTSLLKLGPQDTLDLVLEGSSTADTVSVESLTVNSELGKLSGRGKAVFKVPQFPDKVESTAAIALSARGSERLGAWLPIMTSNAIQSDGKALTVVSSLVPCNGSSAAFNMQFGSRRLCFRNRFEKRAATF